MVYMYQAALYCEECGEGIRRRLDEEGATPENPEDETSYDSDEYPKGPEEPSASDTPQHCDCGEDCLNAIEFTRYDATIGGPVPWKIGAWLENDLTEEGYAYVKSAEPGPVRDLWFDLYEISKDDASDEDN